MMIFLPRVSWIGNSTSSRPRWRGEQLVPDEARQNLARQQAAMVQSLLGAAPAPEGIDPGQAKRAAKSLASKRRRELEKSLPWVPREQQREFGAIIGLYLSEFSPPVNLGI